MSFRHTCITEFLYKFGNKKELDLIEKTLNEYGTFFWCGKGMEGLGYFHGIIKDLNSLDTKEQENEILKRLLDIGVKISIVFE